MNNGNFSLLDVITVLSFVIAIQNLEENRQQTADNDVHKANDQQAEFLLKEIDRKFDELKELILNERNNENSRMHE